MTLEVLKTRYEECLTICIYPMVAAFKKSLIKLNFVNVFDKKKTYSMQWKLNLLTILLAPKMTMMMKHWTQIKMR